MASIAAGAEIGGEVGLIGGPLGAAAGAVIGGLIGLGVAVMAVKAIEHANHDADKSLSKGAPAQACADCGDGPDCFEPPDGADPKEFKRQLQEQQDEINKLSPDKMLKRLKDADNRYAQKLKETGKGDYRGEGDAAERQRINDREWSEAYQKASQAARKARMSPRAAEKAATIAADAAVKGKDALHALDWSVGGDGKVSRMGGRSENRSIGKQWNIKMKGSQLTRREQLRRAAEKAKKQGKSKMDINLEEC